MSTFVGVLVTFYVVWCSLIKLSNVFFFSFLGISQSLPSTSYIKLIEVWMLFTMIYPFAEIVVLCIEDMLKAKQGAFINNADTLLNKTKDSLLHILCKVSGTFNKDQTNKKLNKKPR